MDVQRKTFDDEFFRLSEIRQDCDELRAQRAQAAREPPDHSGTHRALFLCRQPVRTGALFARDGRRWGRGNQGRELGGIIVESLKIESIPGAALVCHLLIFCVPRVLGATRPLRLMSLPPCLPPGARARKSR